MDNPHLLWGPGLRHRVSTANFSTRILSVLDGNISEREEDSDQKEKSTATTIAHVGRIDSLATMLPTGIEHLGNVCWHAGSKGLKLHEYSRPLTQLEED